MIDVKQLIQLLGNWQSLADNTSCKSGVCCCGEDMDNHSIPYDCGHQPVDSGEYYLDGLLAKTKAFIAELEVKT